MRGFSIIEIIIYIGLLSIILTSSLTTSYFLLDTAKITETKIAANEEKNFLLNMAKLVAENIVNRSYGPHAYKNYGLSVESGTLYLQIDMAQRRPLNTAKIKVENLIVTNIDAHGVNIELQIDGQNFEINKNSK